MAIKASVAAEPYGREVLPEVAFSPTLGQFVEPELDCWSLLGEVEPVLVNVLAIDEEPR